jgi:hypothetical protein
VVFPAPFAPATATITGRLSKPEMIPDAFGGNFFTLRHPAKPVLPFSNRPELPVHKPAHRALAVCFDTHQQTRRFGGSFVMRIRPGFQMLENTPTAHRRIRGLQAVGERLQVARPAQCQYTISTQQRFEGTTDFSPKLNLAGD